MDEKITSIIADDSGFFRTFMRDLNQQLHIEVLAEYGSGDLMMEALSMGEVEHPELVFLDINMPGKTGKEIIEQLLDITPESVIIMVSTISDAKTVQDCLKLGASNFINKDTDAHLMKEIIFSTMKNNGLI